MLKALPWQSTQVDEADVGFVKTRLGYISTEGGPLLVLDREAAPAWSGALAAGGKDYARASEPFDADPTAVGAPIQIGAEFGVVWDMPTGTAEVWRITPEVVLICRAWVNGNENVAEFLANIPMENAVLLGKLVVHSGWVLILWAAASGDEVMRVEPSDGRSLNLSVGHAGMLVSLAPGAYVCCHDEVTDDAARALRCWILPEAVLANESRCRIGAGNARLPAQEMTVSAFGQYWLIY